jgi:amidohydrolase
MKDLSQKMILPEGYLADLIALRKQLHRHAELSGGEKKSAQIIREFVSRFKPDEVITELGGNGVAVIYNGAASGPAVLLRAELDALPIAEADESAYKSIHPGVSHKCGHDGHMTIVAGLAGLLHRTPPKKGRVILLFQPAEETGQGATGIVDGQNFGRLAPDYVFALHNLPGNKSGRILVKSGAMTCASIGMHIRLNGKTAHASRPEEGLSPAAAMCEIIRQLPVLDSVSQLKDNMALVTVVYACMGAKSYGTAPGFAEIMATLRAETDHTLDLIRKHAFDRVSDYAQKDHLGYTIDWHDHFSAGANDEQATRIVANAADAAGFEVEWLTQPFRWSEDFGVFTSRFPGALFAMGAGRETPPLHSPAYDFPDRLIEPGLRIYREIIEQLLNQ